jgi:hypothetical protein
MILQRDKKGSMTQMRKIDGYLVYLGMPSLPLKKSKEKRSCGKLILESKKPGDSCKDGQEVFTRLTVMKFQQSV